jgi:RHS repeat-associated protein
VYTTFGASTGFLTAPGSTTGQANVPIEPGRRAVIRGRVTALDGAGAESSPAVSITIKDHPELGTVTSGNAGEYAIVVNGGGDLVVHFELAGHISAERHAKTTWHEFTILEDVALVTRSALATSITQGASTYQAAWGEVRGGSLPGVGNMDENLARKGLLLFPPNESSPDLPPGPFNVSVTEVTAFRAGARAMPATLPATSGYTYAMELAVAGHEEERVNFTAPVSYYVENFIGLPLGTRVPLGFYDTAAAAWQAVPSGRVIEISGIAVDGKAMLSPASGVSYEGMGVTDDNAVISNAERVALADAYRAQVCAPNPAPNAACGVAGHPAATPKQLWRMRMQHFTTYDANWGLGLPAGAGGPPTTRGPKAREPVNQCKAKARGSIIECQNRVLGEEIPIPGTPYSLTYRSSRTEVSNVTVDIPITDGRAFGAGFPAPLRIEADIEVAGRRERLVRQGPTFPLNQTLTWTWDRKDAFGHTVEGAARGMVTVRYVHRGLVGATVDFGAMPTGTNFVGDRNNRELGYEISTPIVLGSRSATATGLGGWQLSDHGLSDPQALAFHTGRGDTIKTEGDVTQVVGGRVTGPDSPVGAIANGSKMAYNTTAMAVAPDGRVYWSAVSQGVRYVAADGTIASLGGTNCADPWPPALLASDEIPADQACVGYAESMVVGGDGTVYVADHYKKRILAFRAGSARLVAGRKDGQPGTFADGALGVTSALYDPKGVALDGEGRLLFATPRAAGESAWIVRVTADGRLVRVAGKPTGSGCSGNPPTSSTDCMSAVVSLTVDPEGNIFAFNWESSNYNSDIYKIRLNGTVERAVGSRSGSASRRGGALGTNTYIGNSPGGLLYCSGSLYYQDPHVDMAQLRALRPDGRVQEVLGISPLDVGVSEEFAPSSHPRRTVLGPMWTMARGPMGEIYTLLATVQQGYWTYRIGRLGDPMTSQIVDGNELHELDLDGRHVATRSRLRGTTLRSFTYNATDKTLASVTDANGQTLSISGDATTRTLTAPNGMVTTLTLDANRHLSKVTSPDGSERLVAMDAKGLLTKFGKNGDPADANAHHFTYDEKGLLVSDLSPDGQGSAQRLSSTSDVPKRIVTHTTAEGRTKTFEVDRSPTATVNQEGATERRVNTVVTGLASAGNALSSLSTVQEDFGANRSVSVAPSGAKSTVEFRSDPKLGSAGQFASKVVLETKPGDVTNNRTTTTTHARTIAPDDSEQVDTTTVNGQSWESRFTRAPGTIATTTPTGRRTTTWFDGAIDRAVRVQVGPGIGDPGTPDPVMLHPVEYTYESGPGPQQGKIATVKVGSRTMTYTYDAAGYVSTVTAPDGKVTTFNFRDTMGRVTQMTLPGGRVVSHTYDVHGNVTSVVPPLNATLAPAMHEMSYSPSGSLLASYLAPDVGGAPRTTSYTYDRDKLLKELVSPVGSLKRTVSRDAAGRIVAESETTSGANRTRTFTYGTTGQLMKQVATEVAGGTTSATQEFDYLGSRHTSDKQTVAGGTARFLTRDHDAFLRLSSMSLTGVGTSVTYAYDNDGLVTNIGGLVATRGTTVGLVKQLERAGKEKEDFTYDEYGAPLTMLASYNGVSKGGLTLTFDPASGRIVTKAEAWTFAGLPSKTWTYTYDAAGRLFEAYDGVTTKSYTYDDNGNRTGATVDAQDRVTSQTDGGVTTTYAYDAHGNVTTRTRGALNQSLSWDSQGSLLAVTQGATTVKYVVDAQGRRVGRRVGPTLDREWFYDGQLRIVGEVLQGPTPRYRLYGYLPERHLPVMMTETVSGITKTYRIYGDHLGSLRAVVESATGNVVQVMQHDPWGEVDVDTVTGPFVRLPFGFAGGNYDELTGLVRFGAREYDAGTGRWLSKDEARFGGGWNFYEYAASDPSNRIDPTGMAPLDVLLCLVNGGGWSKCWEDEGDRLEDGCRKHQTVCQAVGGIPGRGGPFSSDESAIRKACKQEAEIALADCLRMNSMDFSPSWTCRHVFRKTRDACLEKAGLGPLQENSFSLPCGPGMSPTPVPVVP